MKKSIVIGVLVFVFSFMSLYLFLDNGQETYALEKTCSNGIIDARFDDDINFCNCVVDFFTQRNIKQKDYLDKYGVFTTKGLDKITDLSCKSRGIKSAKGLKYMHNLVSLNLSNNQLTTVDLSRNEKLVILYLADNKLETVNINNHKFTRIELYNNNLSRIPDACARTDTTCIYGHQVKFMSNDKVYKYQNVTTKKISSPGTPSGVYKPSGSTYFDGWYNSNGQKFKFNEWNITDDIVLYARWSNSSGSSSSSSNSTSSSNSSSSNNSTSSSNSSSSNNNTSSSNNGISLKYDCSKNSSDSKNCKNLPSAETVSQKTRVTFKISSKVPKKDNYTFVFWESKKKTDTAYSSDCSKIKKSTLTYYGKTKCKKTITITKNNTLHAVWKRNGETLPQESETTNSSINSFNVITVFVFGLFIVLGGSVLIYSYNYPKKAKKTSK